MQPQVVALDVIQWQLRNLKRRARDHQLVSDRFVQADNEGGQRVVDRLRRELAGFHRLGHHVHHLTDMLDFDASERDRLKRREKPETAVALIRAPAAFLKAGPAASQPPRKELAESLLCVDDLATPDSLELSSTPVRGHRRTLEAPLAGPFSVGALNLTAVPRALRGLVRADAPALAVPAWPALFDGLIVDRCIECLGCLLGAKPLRSVSPRCIPPSNFPAALRKAMTHHAPYAITGHTMYGKLYVWVTGSLPYSVRQPAPGWPRIRKALQMQGFSPCARVDSNHHGP